MKQPANETCLAVELWLARRDTRNGSVTPFGAAKIAAELCRLGRRFKALSERLCNEPDPTGRTGRSRDAVTKGILKLCEPFHAVPDSHSSGLIVILRTKGPGSRGTEETALL
jgi:hypothetical protein